MTVTPVNDPPTANPDSGSTLEDTSTTIDVAANDTDVETAVVPATVAIASCPGGATCVPNGDGTVTYTPPANFEGNATFTYTIQDTQGGTSAPGTVTIAVSGINDPPVAANDSGTTNQGVPITLNVVSNDSDLDGVVIPGSAVLVTGASNGSVTNHGDGTFTYAPNIGPHLSDSFTYQVSDDDGAASNVATVTIHIREPELQIVKDAIPDSANPGDEIQFFIYVVNNGPGTAFSASLSDSLGSCFRWIGSPSFGSLGNLDEGEAVVRAPRARVVNNPDPACDNTNTASVDAANASRVRDSASVTILSLAAPPALPLVMGGGPELLLEVAPMLEELTATPEGTPGEPMLATLLSGPTTEASPQTSRSRPRPPIQRLACRKSLRRRSQVRLPSRRTLNLRKPLLRERIHLEPMNHRPSLEPGSPAASPCWGAAGARGPTGSTSATSGVLGAGPSATSSGDVPSASPEPDPILSPAPSPSDPPTEPTPVPDAEPEPESSVTPEPLIVLPIVGPLGNSPAAAEPTQEPESEVPSTEEPPGEVMAACPVERALGSALSYTDRRPQTRHLRRR